MNINSARKQALIKPLLDLYFEHVGNVRLAHVHFI